MLIGKFKHIFWGVGIILICLSPVVGWHVFKSSKSNDVNSHINLEKTYGKENLIPFLVLGSGPASLSAALYGARTRIKTIVLRGNKPGGQLTGTSYIENWPGIRRIRGTEVVKQHQEQAEHFGAVMVDDAASLVDFSQWPYMVQTEEGKTLYAMAVMIGTGATARGLKVPGESEYWGKGVTTCAICDAPYHRDHHVVVIGGGDSAMEEALELSAYAAKVSVLIRGDKLRASPSMIERVSKCVNVEIVYNRSIVAIKGDGHHVTNIDIKNSKTNALENWPIGGVFLGIGHDPNTKLFKDYLKMSSTGYLEVNCRTQQTSLPGIVAAGDVCDPRYRQAGVAAGDGIKAGLDVVWWLSALGYNTHVQDELEPYFFDPSLDKKVEVAQLNSEAELQAALKKSKERLMLLDFFTDSCPTCMHMLPVIEWGATKLAGRVKFYKIDAAGAFDLTKKYKVPDVPHLVVLRDGKVVGRYHDVMDRNQLYSYLKKFIESDNYKDV